MKKAPTLHSSPATGPPVSFFSFRAGGQTVPRAVDHPSSGEPETVTVACAPACPRCGGAIKRVPRRSIDYLISIFALVHRYRCRSFSCHWEGNLRNPHDLDNRRYHLGSPLLSVTTPVKAP